MTVEALYQPAISKSKYLSGLQCRKLLWAAYNAKERFPPVDAADQAIFDQGHAVGNLAKDLFPHGIEVAPNTRHPDAVVAVSKSALLERRPLFEAGFRYKNAYARFDILNPIVTGGAEAWELFEVKSGTSVKDVNIPDVAIQLYILEGMGIPVARACVMHINNQYVRHGLVDPRALFVAADVTEEARAWLEEVEGDLEEFAAVIAGPEPDTAIGPHCLSPYGCPLQDRCWSFLPVHNPTTLASGRGLGFALIEKGVHDIAALPEKTGLTARQAIQVRAVREDSLQVDRDAVARFLDTLRPPLLYLDFETLATAVPLFDGVRPYQAVPFQYSLHLDHRTDKQAGHRDGVAHVGFLAEGIADPRPAFLVHLRAHLPAAGTIVAYHAPFEKRILRELARDFPAYADWVDEVEARFVDLLAPFRAFHVYHPAQMGSASIKAVLPALTGKSYGDLDVAEGMTASNEFVRVTYGEVDAEERSRVREALEAYCKLDTEAMMDLVSVLEGVRARR
jgi:hypothetical protein